MGKDAGHENAFNNVAAERQQTESPTNKVPRQQDLQGACWGKEGAEPPGLGPSNIHQVQPRAFAKFQLASIVNSVTGADWHQWHLIQRVHVLNTQFVFKFVIDNIDNVNDKTCTIWIVTILIICYY